MTHIIEIYSLDPTTGAFTREDIIASYKDLSYNYSNYNQQRISTCSFVLDMYDTKASARNLVRWKNHVVIKSDDVIVWFGAIATISFSMPNNDNASANVTVTAMDMLAHFQTRITASLVQYTNEDLSDIAWDLVSDSQNQTNGNLGISRGFNPTTRNVDRTYEYGQISQLLINMTQLVDWIDFDFTANTDGDNLFSGCNFNVYYKKGQLHNFILDFSKCIEFTGESQEDMINTITALGSGFDQRPSTSVEDTSMQEAYTRRERLLVNASVSLEETLEEQAAGELDRRKPNVNKFSVVLDPRQTPHLNEIFVGDYVSYNFQTLPGAFVQFEGTSRVNDISVKLDQTGQHFIRLYLEFTI